MSGRIGSNDGKLFLSVVIGGKTLAFYLNWIDKWNEDIAMAFLQDQKVANGKLYDDQIGSYNYGWSSVIQ